MPIVKSIHEGGVALLEMQLGRGNAIDDVFLSTMAEALDQVEGPEVRAVVITGQGRAFCGGLDLVRAAGLDAQNLGHFVDAFDACFERIFAFPVPVVAAINGHALAGGCILAMAADHRIMTGGPFLIGVNEVLLGIPFPAASYEIARQATPAAAQRQTLLGRRYSTEEALAKGLIHSLATEAGVVADAIAEARRLSAGSAEAVRDVKGDLVAPVLAQIAATREVKRTRFIERWLGPEAQARIGAMRDELLKKKAAK